MILTITPDAAYVIDIASATINIIDDDVAAPDVSIVPASGNATENGSVGAFRFIRTGSTVNPLTIQLATPTGTATSGIDYNTQPTSIIILAGQSERAINFTPIDDSLIEGTETVIFTIAADAAYNITTGSATVNITDNDFAATDVSIIQTSHATENGGIGSFRISRTGSTANPLTVQLATPTGTATSGVDYNTQPSSVTLPAGSSNFVLNISAIDDALVESTETVIFTITADAAYNITTGSATVNIVDNDTNSSSTATIPTLTTWALILMILSLIFIAIPKMTRKNQT